MLDGMTRGPNSTLAHLFIGRNQIEHHGFHVLFQPPAPIPASRDLYERRSLRCLSTRANKGLDVFLEIQHFTQGYYRCQKSLQPVK